MRCPVCHHDAAPPRCGHCRRPVGEPTGDPVLSLTDVSHRYGAGDGKIPTGLIQQRFRTNWGLPADLEIVPYGTLRNYREIRTSKPILRLVDSRASSTQEVPRYL